MNIRFHNCSYQYETLASNNKKVLKNIDFEVKHGEMVAIVGSTGSGKTTLLQHFNGLLKPTEGRLFYEKGETEPITDTRSIRQSVGLVFQFPENQFFEETVFEEIEFGLKFMQSDPVLRKQAVRDMMNTTGLAPERYGTLSPFELSGGEKRRLAIACVLVMNPEVLVLDEPTAGLDAVQSKRIEGIIRSLHEQQKTIIFVSHDMDLVARLAKRIFVMHQGKIVFDGPPEALFSDMELLEKTHLRPPMITQYLQGLQKEGIDIETTLFSLESVKAALKHLILEGA